MTAPFPGDEPFENSPCLAGRSTYAKDAGHYPVVPAPADRNLVVRDHQSAPLHWRQVRQYDHRWRLPEEFAMLWRLPNEVCEAALAHVVQNKAEAAYRRGVFFEKRRQLMDAWADYCTSPVTGNVMAFRR